MKSSREEIELAWQAYRYIAQEMTPAETTAFEDRLDVEQSAREAVARMSEIQYAVRALPCEAFRPRVRILKVVAPAAWMSLGIAASLLVMVALPSMGRLMEGGLRPTAGSPQETEVALAWTPAEQDAVDVEAPAGEMTAESGDFETPSWITAAVVREDDEKRMVPIETEVN